MAASSGASVPTTYLFPPARPTSPSIPDRWRLAKPFAHLPRDDRADHLRQSGMHGNAATCRIGTDAFDIRKDIETGDACETTAQLLRGLIGSLEVLAVAPDASPIHKDAISACLFLARQTAGAFAVLVAGLFPGEAAGVRFDDE